MTHDKPQRRTSAPGLRLTEVHLFWMAVGAIIAFLLQDRSAPTPPKQDASVIQSYRDQKASEFDQWRDEMPGEIDLDIRRGNLTAKPDRRRAS